MSEVYKYKSGILGGTFDNIHKGHKYFIEKAFEIAKFITIGITIDEFVKDKQLSYSIESYEIRKTELENYLTEKGFHKRSKIIPISDIFGNTLIEKDIDVIFATDDTLNNSKLVNKKREEIGFPPLEIIVFETLHGNDKNAISSTRIRMGEIDQFGESFLLLFEKHKKLLLPDKYRDYFKKPIGEIVKDPEIILQKVEGFFIISIGDIVTSTLISSGKIPNLSVFDFKTKRERIVDEKILSTLPAPDITLQNLHGTIVNSTATTIHQYIIKNIKTRKPYSIKIIGEEDLLTVPAILLAPINAKVIYGMRGIGSIIVTVTLQKKKELLNEYYSKLES